MLLVVPAEETLAEAARVLQSAEALREFRTVLQRLELTFREGIVIRDMRPAQTSGDSEIGEQQRTGLEVIAGPRRNESSVGPSRCFA